MSCRVRSTASNTDLCVMGASYTMMAAVSRITSAMGELPVMRHVGWSILCVFKEISTINQTFHPSRI